MLDGGEDPAPAASTPTPERHRAGPHEVRGMSDDLTVMGIAAAAADLDGARGLFSMHQAVVTRLRATRMSRQTRSRGPDLAVALASSQGDASRSASIARSSRLTHQQRLDQSRASVADAYAGGVLGPMAGVLGGRAVPCPSRGGPTPRLGPDPAGRMAAYSIAAMPAPIRRGRSDQQCGQPRRLSRTVDDGGRAVSGEGQLLVTVQRWNDPPIR